MTFWEFHTQIHYMLHLYFSLSPSQLLHCPLIPLASSIVIINIYTYISLYNTYSYIYQELHIFIFFYLYLSVLFITDVFRADHFRLPNLPRCLTLEKMDSPSLSSHWLTVALHSVVDSWKLSPTHVGIPPGVVIVLVLFRQPHCWNFIDAASLFCLENTISNTYSYSLSTLIWKVTWALAGVVVLRM